MLLTRVLTALLGAPLLVALIVWGPAWGFPALTVVLVALALHELYTLTTPGTPPWLRGLGILVGSAIAVSWLCCQGPQLALAVATLGTLALLLAHLRLAGELPAAAPRIAASLGGLAYGVLPLTHLGLLYQLPPGWKLVLLVLLFTFAGDTLAYFVGRAVGRRPFAPRVSPKKTWEGALGGLLGSTLACLAWRQWVMPELTLVDVLVLGLGVGFCGQLGDLCESLIKRSVGVKDSGKLLPGHGGVLDRFDAVSFSAPLVYYYYLAFVDAARPLHGWLQLKPF